MLLFGEGEINYHIESLSRTRQGLRIRAEQPARLSVEARLLADLDRNPCMLPTAM